MAYDNKNLTISSGNVKSGAVPAMYTFYNSASDTVTSAGYFVDSRLVVGDIIIVQTADFTSITFYRVSAVVSGAATVLALTSVNP